MCPVFSISRGMDETHQPSGTLCRIPQLRKACSPVCLEILDKYITRAQKFTQQSLLRISNIFQNKLSSGQVQFFSLLKGIFLPGFLLSH